MYVLIARLNPGKFLLASVPIALLLLGMRSMLVPQGGLDQAVPVGPYANNVFSDSPTAVDSGDWEVKNAFPNLSFSKPIFLAEEPQTGLLFVGEHRGMIYSFPNAANASQKKLVLDIRSRTWFSGESGLLSFAFHPQYDADSNYLYVFYQYNDPNSSLNYSRVSRFTMNRSSGTAINNSEVVLIQQYDRASNHNGGMIFFGLDGYLYISTGDEGGGNNQYNNSQSITNRLLGGVLRIDVDRNPSRSHPIRRQPAKLSGSDKSFTAHYYIPNDNPFLSNNGNYLEEFYAIGLRNPHRMSQDPATGTIWLADVGQGRREEIDLIEKGGNYQWAYKEGFLTGSKSKPSNLVGTDKPPIHEYPHSEGKSVTGGYVYRGNRYPSLQGAYVFGDYITKRLWVLRKGSGNTYRRENVLNLSFSLSSFGVDASGELYLLNFSGGKIEKLEREFSGSNPNPTPTLLSQTGVFKSLSPLVPEDFCVPYNLNVPFWSDGAAKYRWLILPNDGQHNSPAEQIQYSESGDWIFPEGSVLIKHFELPLDEQNPNSKRKLETRFMIFGPDNTFKGLSYIWNDAQTDATLSQESRQDTFTVQTPYGERKISWFYPGSSDCLTCHTPMSGGALGLKTGQLNRAFRYPRTGREANQLTTLAQLNMFSRSPDTQNLATLPFFPPSDEAQYSLESRARAYLDANCSHCHRPGDEIQANFDARMSTPLDEQKLIYGDLVKDLGMRGAKAIIPGDEAQSLILARMQSVHTEIAMPQLAKNEVDSAGVTLISSWIQSLSPNFVFNGKTGQKITFSPIGNKHPLDPSFALSASSTSGLPISFQVVSGPASIVNNQLSLTGSQGKVEVVARQSGNSTYHPAPEMVQSFWVLNPGDGSGRGLEGVYHSDNNLVTEVFRRVDPIIDFNWNSSSPAPSSMGYENFSIRWDGEIQFPFSEAVTFITPSDDGVRLYVNNTLIIDNWYQNGPGERSATINMNAWEKVPIRMEFREKSTYASVSLRWSSPSIAPQVVPQEFLYSSASETPTLHAWLEGYFDPQIGSMTNELQAGSILPSQQPFQDPPLSYNGNEAIASNDAYILDWVLIEARDAQNPAQVRGRKAILIAPDGHFMDTDFSPNIILTGLTTGAYYIALYPKSHLPVMSSAPVPYSSSTGFGPYDFTQPDAVLGTGQLKVMGAYHVLHAGDFDYNGIINNLDFNLWKQNSAAINQYMTIDADGNGIINNLDFNLWKGNGSKLAPDPLQK